MSDSGEINEGYASGLVEELRGSSRSASSNLVGVSIDFGTTYSGYAYMFKHEYEDKKMTIHCNNWTDGGQGQINVKTPTYLLLNPDKTLNSFGHTAMQNYSEICLDDEEDDYYFFMTFKMELHTVNEINSSLKIKAVNGKSLRAITVFSRAIEFFRKHFFDMISKRNLELQDADVRWVLTVPAIWNESAKKFMRDAAAKAGLPKENVEIALEPEAASLFCRVFDCGVHEFPVGTRYMVADCGGGTVDIAVHEVLENNMLRELHQATGGHWGGTQVTQNILKLIENVLGSDVYKIFAKRHMSDYLDLLKEVEETKRLANPYKTEKITLKLPPSLLLEFKTKNNKECTTECVPATLKDYITFVGEKIRIASSKFIHLFQEAIRDIIAHIADLLDSIEPKVEMLLMVGGFSESPILMKRVEEVFKDKVKIITPAEASLSVVKGAVLFGFEPEKITERRSRYTYGIDQTIAFNEGVHPPYKKITVNNKPMVDGVFDIHVRVGDVVKYGEWQTERVYYPISPDDLEYSVMLYRSTTREPMFTSDDTCELVGCYYMKRPYEKGKSIRDEEVKVKLAFGRSDICVHVTANDGSVVTPEFKM